MSAGSTFWSVSFSTSYTLILVWGRDRIGRHNLTLKLRPNGGRQSKNCFSGVALRHIPPIGGRSCQKHDWVFRNMSGKCAESDHLPLLIYLILNTSVWVYCHLFPCRWVALTRMALPFPTTFGHRGSVTDRSCADQTSTYDSAITISTNLCSICYRLAANSITVLSLSFSIRLLRFGKFGLSQWTENDTNWNEDYSTFSNFDFF